MNVTALHWNEILNITKVEVELISDASMCFFLKKGMRGGIFYISKRNIKANNKYLKSYDPRQESKHIHILRC